MKFAPIVYGRTRYCDFNSNFIVRPACFNEELATWASNKVNHVISDISESEEGRWLVADGKGYRLAGFVVRITELLKKLSLEDDGKYFSRDEHNRRVFAFVGGVFSENELPSEETFSYETILEIYKEHVKNIWETTNYEQEITKTVVLSGETCRVLAPQWEKTGNTFYATSQEEHDKKCFDYFLTKEYEEELDFCSNLVELSEVEQWKKENNLFYFTTSNNLFSQIKENPSLLGGLNDIFIEDDTSPQEKPVFSSKAELITWLQRQCDGVSFQEKDKTYQIQIEESKKFGKHNEIVKIYLTKKG